MRNGSADLGPLEAAPATPRPVGRPRKDARNAAVYLAMHWRQESLGETRNQSQEWVRRAWVHHGLGSDRKDVRAARKFALERGLGSNITIETGFVTAVECLRGSPTIRIGARTWMWAPGMFEAAEGRVTRVHVSKVRERMDVVRHPVAAAAVAALYGDLGDVDRDASGELRSRPQLDEGGR
jgi:hypothetical protein